LYYLAKVFAPAVVKNYKSATTPLADAKSATFPSNFKLAYPLVPGKY